MLEGQTGNVPAAMALSSDSRGLKAVMLDALVRAKGRVKFEVKYFTFLNSCMQPRALDISCIKRSESSRATERESRFASVLEVLRNLPPLELAVAEALGCVADELRVRLASMQDEQGSAGRSHFEVSSSFGLKGRILDAIIRGMHCTRTLELGTAYGLSAMFILEAMASQAQASSLVTVERSKTIHEFASHWLVERYRHRVDCELGSTSAVIPRLADTLAPVDFMFHDAGHSGVGILPTSSPRYRSWRQEPSCSSTISVGTTRALGRRTRDVIKVGWKSSTTLGSNGRSR